MFSRRTQTTIPPVQDAPAPPLGGRPGMGGGGLPSRYGAASVSAGPGNYRPQASLSMNAAAPPAPVSARPAPSRQGLGGAGAFPDPRRNNSGGGGGGGRMPPSRGPSREEEAEQQRNKLFSGGRTPVEGAPSRYAYGGYSDASQDQEPQQQQEYDDEDEEVEGIKQQIRDTNAKTLASSRNALRMAMQAEETGRRTLGKLGEQGVRLGNIDHHLDMGDLNASRSEDTTKEINALNRSIFRPTFTMNKQGKRDAQEQKILQRHQAEQAGREALRRNESDSRARTDATLQQLDRQPTKPAGGLRSRLAEKSRYQFENTAEDDAVDDEIEDNIDEIAAYTGRLKILSEAMGNEIRSQNDRLDTIMTKTDALDSRIYSQTQRLKNIK